VNIAEESRGRTASRGGKALAGFFLSGFLLALPGAIIPAWIFYDRDPANFITVGNYFLSLALGITVSTRIAGPLLARRGLGFLLVTGCLLSCAGLVFLSEVTPPASQWWRIAGLFALGIGAGLLHAALFHGISRRYQSDPAGTVTLAGIFYGLGCLAATLLVAGTFFVYSVTTILIFMAAVPFLFAVLYSRTALPIAETPAAQRTVRQVLDDFRSPGAVLFALLLFFQFGSEWSIAGWLPIFLHGQMSISYSTAITVLALYWFFLLIGRLIAIAVLPRVRHGRLLMGSVLTAIFGCVVLYWTQNTFGAITGAFFLGAGFASIYPLVAEAIGRRFPYYHPGFFNGIFTFAQVGGLLAPATLGYAAEAWDIRVVLLIPFIGTFMVMALLILIWLESKVTGR
jgi:fucose permease